MTSEENKNERLVIVSNRLPIALSKDKNNQWHVKPGSGGLVTALAPVLRNRGGIWIGWPGNVAENGIDTTQLLQKETKAFGYKLKPIDLSREEKEKYYQGFANEIIWPLFHDFVALCKFNPEYWFTYKQVNRRFAETIKQNAHDSDFIWVHDYHLIGVGSELRNIGIKNRIAFFLHIPFPPPDVFIRLPWRFQILNSLLGYDLVGFQTMRDRRNFVQCIRQFITGVNIEMKGQIGKLIIGDREVRVGALPISIDFREMAKKAESREVVKQIAEIKEGFNGQKIILGIDRLDYSKGIPERLKGFRNALKRFPELREKITLIQVVVPSRRDIESYADLKIEIERLVGEINGQFTRSNWVPIHYFFRSLDKTELLATYRACEIALITPLKDGMNLIAKEYCAANTDETGVLIMSEFAGAASQFQKHALLVNPHDIEGIAEAIHRAYRMNEKERKSRMRVLRQNVMKYNIFWWVDNFLQAAIAKNLDSFPLLDEYMPTIRAE